MNIQKIILELNFQEIINSSNIKYEKLNGGTVSNLYLLDDGENGKFVVKSNEPQVLEAEVHFLDFYKDINLLPNLVYIEPSYHYIVYSFVSGSTNYGRKNKKEILTSLVQHFINHYKIVPRLQGWGWADDLTDSWQDFLLNRVFESKKTLNSYLKSEDSDLVIRLVKSHNRNNSISKPFLLHGDCGVHNFIFKEGHFCGVIDPSPVYGEPIYDLIYAFCSSPDDLTIETIDSAVNHLKFTESESRQLIYEKVLIGLYLRLATCIKRHPEDKEDYLRAWSYWKEIVKET